MSYCCSVAKSCPNLCNPMDYSMPGFPVFRYVWEFSSNTRPLSQWWHPIISSSVVPFSSGPQSFSASGLFQWVGSLHQVAKVLELQLYQQSSQWISTVDFLWDWLILSPFCPKGSQESYPAPQLESINSSAISLLYGSTVTSIINDYQKNNSFDYTDLAWKSDVSAFEYAV